MRLSPNKKSTNPIRNSFYFANITVFMNFAPIKLKTKDIILNLKKNMKYFTVYFTLKVLFLQQQNRGSKY